MDVTNDGGPAPEESEADAAKPSNAYDMFILVLTLLSLVIMVLVFLPFSKATNELLNAYDNFICVIFLFDFAWRLRRAKTKRDYFIGERGWLDLLGSIPAFGVFEYTAILRLARLSRLARVTRVLRGQNKKELVDDVVKHRSQYAVFVTLLAAMLVIVAASIFVLQFESKSPEANITTGGDALWWAIVTITTVGYGDQYPVTALGRFTGVLVMFTGVGIIGALASIFASILVPPKEQDAPPAVGASPPIQTDLDEIKAELASIHRLLAERDPPQTGS